MMSRPFVSPITGTGKRLLHHLQLARSGRSQNQPPTLGWSAKMPRPMDQVKRAGPKAKPNGSAEVHSLVHKADGHGTLADGGCHPLGRTTPDVPSGEKAWQAGLERRPRRSSLLRMH